MKRLEGRTAIVTGGGRGIGRDTALALAGEGCRVAVASRTAGQLEETAALIRDAGAEALVRVCDVTRETEIEGLLGAVRESFGPAEILVNSAGDAISAPLGRTTDELWERMIAVNLTSVFQLTRACIPSMVERGWGRVVNVASTAGRAGFAYVSAYCAAKHGVVGLTRAVAREIAPSGVTVNAVCPGFVDTEMTRRSIERIVETTGRPAAEVRSELERVNPQGRMITAMEVASLVRDLCLPESGGINGQAIVLDGGDLQR